MADLPWRDGKSASQTQPCDFLMMTKTTIEEGEAKMTVERMVLRFAGGMVLISLLLAQLHSRHWLWLTAFVGANLLQASFTGFCPLAKLFKSLGMEAGKTFR